MSAAIETESRIENPFGNAPVVAAPSASVAALMQREIAEIQAAMTVAKKFPRDPKACVDRIINAFARQSLAEQAMYNFSRGGSAITGLSIRALEEISRNWGNMVSGVKEISRSNDRSEVLAYAWDLETGFKDEKIFVVRHWRDRKNGQGYIVTDERDIYEVVANVAARRKRACMEAVIPGDVQEAAERQAVLTLKSKVKITPELVDSLVQKFAEFSVTPAMIEKRIQRGMHAIEPGHVIMLGRIYNTLRDNMAVVSDFFDVSAETASISEDEAPSNEKGTEGAKARMRAKQSGRQQPQRADSKDEQQQDLGGAIPVFDEDAAIQALDQARDVSALDRVWMNIVSDYDDTKRSMPKSIADRYSARKAELQRNEL